jgi:surface carbohydrate biosynthesis protein
VHEFARREGFHLRILGKDHELGREYQMYRQHLGDEDGTWTFTPRATLLANYSEIDTARAVVSSSSTLGYEALGRGARSAFFMIDYEMLGDEGTRFGWPADLPHDGPFWSHTLSLSEVVRVLSNVVLSDEDQWWNTNRETIAQLITFDENNATFDRLINER